MHGKFLDLSDNSVHFRFGKVTPSLHKTFSGVVEIVVVTVVICVDIFLIVGVEVVVGGVEVVRTVFEVVSVDDSVHFRFGEARPSLHNSFSDIVEAIVVTYVVCIDIIFVVVVEVLVDGVAVVLTVGVSDAVVTVSLYEVAGWVVGCVVVR